MNTRCTHLEALRAVEPRTPPSFEPGEDWGWCYEDELFLEPAPTPRGGA